MDWTVKLDGIIVKLQHSSEGKSLLFAPPAINDALRLHRAMRKLRPAECLALAFVMGAGLGSIIHMLFMAVLLAIRTIRYGRLSKEEHRAKRAGKRAKKNGRGIIRLEGEDALGVSVERGPEVVGDVEALPGYEADVALARKLAQDKA